MPIKKRGLNPSMLKKKKRIGKMYILGLSIIVVLAIVGFSIYLRNISLSNNSKASTMDTQNRAVAGYIPGADVKSLTLLNINLFSNVFPSVGRSSVTIAKYVPETGGWITIGGFLYDKNKLVTVKHVPVDSSWIYTYGPNFGENFSKNIQFNDIDHVVTHDSLDLSVIVLKNDSSRLPLPIANTVNVGETATIGSSRELVWKTFEEKILAVGEWDPRCISVGDNCSCINSSIPFCVKELNNYFPKNSVFTAPYKILAPGDCGAPVTQDGMVLGYAFGQLKTGYFDSGKTTFINVTNPEVRAWIDSVK